MFGIEWTTELIAIVVIATVFAFVIGFLITKLTYAPKVTELQAETERLNTELADFEATKASLSESETNFQRAQITQAELSAQLKAEQDKVAQTRNELAQVKQKAEQDTQHFNSLNAEHTELKTTLTEREKHFEKQLKHLEESKELLTKEFENLANKIFAEKSKAFSDSNSEHISNLLKPFREQIEGFQKRVNEVHDASIKGNSDLNAEIKKVLDIGLQMSDEANSLTNALRGDAKQRGLWGEVQLEKTLQLSGLREHDHYESEANFKTETGKNRRPDYLIKLPDDKHIIIDSKVSLVAYDKAVNAETPEEGTVAMTQHTDAVKRHIDELADKDYTNLIGVHSPSFVLMFMPIEPAFIEAMKHNRDLFDYGYSKGIVLVSHTTLIPILRTVSNLWMIERSNAEARQISDKAGEIYNTVCTLAGRLNSLGGTLKTATNHYNDTVRSLVGQQGLYGKVSKFTELSSRISKSLPDLSTQEVDIEQDRVKLVVEEIKESQEHSDKLVKLEDKRQKE